MDEAPCEPCPNCGRDVTATKREVRSPNWCFVVPTIPVKCFSCISCGTVWANDEQRKWNGDMVDTLETSQKRTGYA